MTTDRPAVAPGADPRPLTGEPLPLDLLNTRWLSAEGRHDLLDSLDGLAIWLRAAGFADRVPADDATHRALLTTREALSRLITHATGTDDQRAAAGPLAAAAEALNETLAHGRLLRELDADGRPLTVVRTDSAHWLPSWSAAEHYLRLLEGDPTRLRACGNPECVLHFYDVSRNGTRRWCSMAGCGNRAKASRHYARQKSRA